MFKFAIKINFVKIVHLVGPWYDFASRLCHVTRPFFRPVIMSASLALPPYSVYCPLRCACFGVFVFSTTSVV
jgi:hypothetical protein